MQQPVILLKSFFHSDPTSFRSPLISDLVPYLCDSDMMLPEYDFPKLVT